ncbi:hypothetical protein F5I97DRAFT_1816909 [Phlebopus sp. FC_14]|nr:hypothetical protein F5I97DRAFT_1816909 [Phlebopus sp. FC_14]
MPLTPPPAFTNPSVSQPGTAEDAFFSLFLEDEYSKVPPLPPATSPYDFLAGMSAAGDAGGMGAGNSPEASTSSGASPSQQANSPQPMFSIDPQLVGTPATSKALSDFDEEEKSLSPFSPQDEEEEMEEELVAATNKPNGRPKVSRKGTVLSGGVKKASAVSTEKENSGKEGKSKKDPLPLKILEPEDWRPSPEEYKKMSSKEKRQLRNKISARNFRVRRKEYITTLEGDIAERDRLIDAIRSELGSSKSENVALRQEIAALKKCLLEGRGLPDLPPPAELPPTSPPVATASTSNVSSVSASSVVTPNTQKDLPTSPRLSSRAFWGGLGGMGVTPVHTTFVPPLAVLASKASVPRSASPFLGSNSPILQPSIFYEENVRSRVLQENINPGLNPTFQRGLVEKKGSANINPSLNGANMGGIGSFDAFADMNPFTLKTLDAYRMQLWGKMAAQQHAFHHSQSQPQQMHTPPHSPSLSPSGLANGLRPHYFTSIPKAGGALSPKAAAVGVGAGAAAYPTPPVSPAPSHATAGPSREQAAIAALASQTLLGKLGHAFWEAFSGSSSSGSSLHSASSSSSAKQWDAEKVRKVLEGRAVVKVVDVEPLPVPVQEKPKTVEKTKTCECTLTDILEESMRSLTLGKK